MFAMSTVKIDNIWDALRVGFPTGPQNTPVIDLEGNLLQFRDHQNVYIPWNRMVWKNTVDP